MTNTRDKVYIYDLCSDKDVVTFSNKQKKELIKILKDTLVKYDNKSQTKYFHEAFQLYTDTFIEYKNKHEIEDWFQFESYCFDKVLRKIKWFQKC